MSKKITLTLNSKEAALLEEAVFEYEEVCMGSVDHLVKPLKKLSIKIGLQIKKQKDNDETQKTKAKD